LKSKNMLLNTLKRTHLKNKNVLKIQDGGRK